MGALGGGQNDAATLPNNPQHFLQRFPSFQDYMSHAENRNITPLSHQQYRSLGRHPQGGGGGGGGGGQQPDFSQPPSSNIPPIVPPGAINPPPTGAPGTPGATGPVSPTLGNTYGNTFQSYAPGQWQAYSGPEPAGLAQGTFRNPEANDTERFTYDTFANGQTYKPMPGPLGGTPGASYPFQGYAAPMANWHYYNPGMGSNFPTDPANYTPRSWDQYAQAMAQPNIANDIQPFFRQQAAPSQAQDVWWANPVITDPGYYDPWTELRNLQQHFGQDFPGNQAGDTALIGGPRGGQQELDYLRYLAHQANIPGYAQLTGPLPAGYHSPNIGGTYGAHG